MHLKSIILTSCLLLSSCYGISVNKRSGDDETTTVRLSDDDGNKIQADDIVSDDSQPGASTTFLPQSDGVELATEKSEIPVESPFEIVYPVTPDPDEDVDYTTVNPLPEGFNVADLDVNYTRGHVYGRASCRCGSPSGRIIGGDPAKINDLPWTAALVRGGINSLGRAYCGGTLINSRYVVTASHCVDGMQASGISVRLNQENIYNSPNVQSYGVSQIIMHPNYNRKNIDHDIALIQLSQPVRLDLNSQVVPACLPASSDFNLVGAKAVVAGWGATVQGGGVSTVLRKVTVPVLSNEECNRDSNYKGRITENMMCAGEMRQGGKDSCQGDSGGPLIVQNGSRATLIGVVSWGYGCAQPLSPGVYARVSRYPEWILANTRGADWCQG